MAGPWEKYQSDGPWSRYATQERSTIEKVGRQLGLTARAGIEGTAAIPNMFLNAMQMHGTDKLSQNLTALGLPEPETPTERIIQSAAQGFSGTAALSKASKLAADAASSPAVANAFGLFARNPGSQATAGAASGAASQTAGELGAPGPVQLAAGLATSYRPGLGLKMPNAESIRNPNNAVKLQTFNEAKAAGFKFPPSVIERGVAREALESMGGKEANKQQFALHNAQVTKQLAKEGAGLKPDQDLTEANLKVAREELAEPYRRVAALSPAAAKALETWRDSNAWAKLHWNDFKANNTVSAYRKYKQFEAKADNALSTMEAEAGRTGNVQLIPELREARVRIAQNWDVDKALNIATGEVRPNELGRMLNKRGKAGMSGPLGVIAKTQQAFPDFMKESAKVGTPGVNKLSYYASGALGLEGYHLGGAKGALIGLAVPQLSRGARRISITDFMQNPRSSGQGIPMSAVTDYLAREQGN